MAGAGRGGDGAAAGGAGGTDPAGPPHPPGRQAPDRHAVEGKEEAEERKAIDEGTTVLLLLRARHLRGVPDRFDSDGFGTHCRHCDGL